AGSGPEQERVDQLGADLLGERYIRRTFPHEQMPDLYRSVDLLLHLSEFESFGNVYVEALATGLPVVAHDSVVTRWILGDDGVLLDTGHHDDLVGAVAEQLRRGRAPGAEQRRRRAEGFSWAVVAEQYQAFLREVVGERP